MIPDPKKAIVDNTIRVLDSLPYAQSFVKAIGRDRLHEHVNPKILKLIKDLLKVKADLNTELAHDSPQALHKLVSDLSALKNDTNLTNENLPKDINTINNAYHEILNSQHGMHITASTDTGDVTLGVTPERIAELSAEAAKEMDHEYAGRMVKSNLFNICEQTRALMPMFEDDENVEPWLEEKIAVAAHMIASAYNYKNYDTNSDKAMPPDMHRKVTAKYIAIKK